MARWVERWHEGSALLIVLWPLSAVFYLISGLRRLAYRQGWLKAWRASVPVIVVGNISVGGTGKTPLTLALVEHLQAAGWRPGIISRGYGGNTTYPCRVSVDSVAAEVGDEPLLLARRSGVPVVIDPVRSHAAAHLLANSDCNVILCDDGLQHLALARDIEIAVIDGQRGLGSGWLLPAGPLRELSSRLRQVDFCVINGGWQRAQPLPALTGADTFDMHLSPAPWLPVSAGVLANDLARPAAGPVHAIAGIGNPPRFFAMLAAQGYEPIAHAFPDHHHYQAGDLRFVPALPLVMTEKDAVKCAGLAPENSWYVPVQAILPELFWQALLSRLHVWSKPHVG